MFWIPCLLLHFRFLYLLFTLQLPHLTWPNLTAIHWCLAIKYSNTCRLWTGAEQVQPREQRNRWLPRLPDLHPSLHRDSQSHPRLTARLRSQLVKPSLTESGATVTADCTRHHGRSGHVWLDIAFAVFSCLPFRSLWSLPFSCFIFSYLPFSFIFRYSHDLFYPVLPILLSFKPFLSFLWLYLTSSFLFFYSLPFVLHCLVFPSSSVTLKPFPSLPFSCALSFSLSSMHLPCFPVMQWMEWPERRAWVGFGSLDVVGLVDKISSNKEIIVPYNSIAIFLVVLCNNIRLACDCSRSKQFKLV